MPSAVRHFLDSKPSDGWTPALRTFDEKVRTWVSAGRVSFLPYLDPWGDETLQMRRTYPLMLRNPVVKISLQTKVQSVASLDLQTTPASDQARDEEIAEFIRYALTEALEQGFPGLCEEVLIPGLIMGHAVSECVWHDDLWRRGKWRGKRFYRAVKSKEYAEPLQDEYRNVVGVRATGYGQNDVFDTTDFIIFKNMALYQGPGSSDFRAAYQALWELDTVAKLHVVHLEKYIDPYMVAIAEKDYQAAVGQELENARARRWGVFPPDVKIEAMRLSQQGPAEYLEFQKDRREQITLSIAGAFLQMLTATSGGDIRGNAKTQQGTAELLVWALASKLAAYLKTQVVPRLVDVNYLGADYPSVSLGGINYGELMQAIQIEEKAQAMGFSLSRKAFARKYSLQPALDDADALKRPEAQPPGGMPLPFSDRGRREPQSKGKPDDDDDEPERYCGGPGSGKPGPCPEGGGKRKVIKDDWRKTAKEIAAQQAARKEAEQKAAPKAPGKAEQATPKLLASELAAQESGNHDTRGLERGMPKNVEPQSVRDGLAALAEKMPAGAVLIRDAYEQVGKKFGLSPDEFHRALFALHDSREETGLAMTGWSKGTDELPDPAHGVPYAGKLFGYVSLRPGAPGTTAGVKRDQARAFADDVAAAGHDGAQAEKLLQAAIRQGTRALADAARPAVARLLADPQAALKAKTLFDDTERETLAKTLAAVSATAELLGRARIRRRAAQVERKFADPRQFCGGPGSGVPGPCPTGQADAKTAKQPSQTKADSKASARAKQAGDSLTEKAYDLVHDELPGLHEDKLSHLRGKVDQMFNSHDAKAVEKPVSQRRQEAEQVALVAARTAQWLSLRYEPGWSEGEKAEHLETVQGLRKLSVMAKKAAEHFKESTAIRAKYGKFSDPPARRFSEQPTDLRVFAEPVKLMPPEEALAYFRKLVPQIGGEHDFNERMERTSFKLAEATDATLLDKIKGAIEERLATGTAFGAAPAEIDALLEQAGVSPANPSYSTLVFRTEAHNSFSVGSQRELEKVSEIFPTWRYANPADSRSRPSHAEKNGKYYPSSRSFTDVRGTAAEDAIQCRCIAIPIDYIEWAELEGKGAKVER